MDACSAFEKPYYVHPAFNSKESSIQLHAFDTYVCDVSLFSADIHFFWCFLLLHICKHTHYTHTLQHYPKTIMQIEYHPSIQLYVLFFFSAHFPDMQGIQSLESEQLGHREERFLQSSTAFVS